MTVFKNDVFKSPFFDVLGLSDPWHDSSFCLYSTGYVIHAEIERFSRKKYEQMNPVVALCHLYPHLLESFSAVAVEEGVFVAPHVRDLIRGNAGNIEAFRETILKQQIGSIQFGHDRSDEEIDAIDRFARYLFQIKDKIFFVGHHASHAANAFFSSPCEAACVIILDGGGLDFVDGATQTVHASVWNARRNHDDPLRLLKFETRTSFGLAWNRIRSALGLDWGEEGTVMAMAAFGSRPAEFRKYVENKLLWLPNEPELPADLAAQCRSFLGEVAREAKTEQQKFNLAAALQIETEARVREFMKGAMENYGGDLCIAGGVFMNCQIVGKLKTWFPHIGRIYVPPAPYDGGISIGAAQFVNHVRLGQLSPITSHSPFAMGERHARIEIIKAICSHNCNYTVAVLDDVVDLLEARKLVAIFAGSSESGRRTLGNRSIVADPRRADTKDYLNSMIKHRQWFRPFAPMVLAEHASEWFEIHDGFESPYMSFAVPVRDDKRSQIPAVVHHDGSARVQTVHESLTPRTHRLLKTWHERTGVPILLNTSFNDQEPIVETPSDAVATFVRTGLDALYFADFGLLVERTPD